MVGDGEGRQKAADQQEDQASLADIQPPRKFQVGGPFRALHFAEIIQAQKGGRSFP